MILDTLLANSQQCQVRHDVLIHSGTPGITMPLWLNVWSAVVVLNFLSRFHYFTVPKNLKNVACGWPKAVGVLLQET